ncbi:MAG: hypothetical protein GC180_06625 [Bacteroidetes bacterium]|nr:hypothetical protein [Bacteroidota bacterium]
MDKLKSISPGVLLPFIVVYFFLNAAGLPAGFTYTLILSPFFIFLSWKKQLIAPYFWFALIALLFFGIHLSNGVDVWTYTKSLTLLFGSFVFILMAILYARSEEAIPFGMKSVTILNGFFLLIALAVLYSPYRESFWYLEPISPGLPIIPRLKMLTYEASYYSLLLVPVFLYYYMKSIFLQGYRVGLLAVLLFVPLLLSFSLGVIAGLVLSLFILYLAHIKWLVLHPRMRRTFLALFIAVVAALAGLYYFYPENPLFVRLQNIPDGTDTSARGRTYEAFELAWLMIQKKSIWFGIGPGQIKLLGREVILNYYHYVQIPEVVRIPNAAAETLAQFGLIGLILRIGAQFWLFFKTRVHANFYRLVLFLFVFIYQFTGSFMSNIAELTIWVFCFLPIVPELNKSNLFGALRISSLKKGEDDA